MSTHSPGPWSIRPVDDLHFGEPTPQDACIITANGLCAGVVWQNRAGVSADAALIAAAPDLLAVARGWSTSMWLSGIEPDADSDNPLKSLLARTHAAIEKAERLA